MKIAILCPRSGYVWRGIEVVANELSKHLPGNVAIFSLEHGNLIKASSKLQLSSSRITRVLRLHLLIYLFLYIEETAYVLGLFESLKKFEPEVILNFGGPIVELFCKLFRKLIGVPFIVVGMAGVGISEVLKAKISPDVYIALTPQNAQFIKSHVPSLKVEVIPNGIDLNFFSPDGRKFDFEELNSMSLMPKPRIAPPLVLSTSALEEGKRVDLLINAMGKLDYGTLVLTGDGPLKKGILQLAKRRLGNRFVYLGVIPWKEIPVLYRTCNVFSLPAPHEAFGNVLIEAMASGLPVVSADDVNRRWIVGQKGGFLIDVTDIDLYAEMLRKTFEKDWGNGPRDQSRNFSYENIGKKYMEIIEALASNKRKI